MAKTRDRLAAAEADIARLTARATLPGNLESTCAAAAAAEDGIRPPPAAGSSTARSSQRARTAARDILSHPRSCRRCDRIAALATLLGDPQRACPVIHITGTNGKTSTARMAETLLRARGLRTGLYTSPHLSSLRERICIDGEPLPRGASSPPTTTSRRTRPWSTGSRRCALSFFEMLTAMAFAAFADAPVDVAVIEVGLGGTWDATNIADGQVAVVTPIALDHTAYLGDTSRRSPPRRRASSSRARSPCWPGSRTRRPGRWRGGPPRWRRRCAPRARISA